MGLHSILTRKPATTFDMCKTDFSDGHKIQDTHCSSYIKHLAFGERLHSGSETYLLLHQIPSPDGCIALQILYLLICLFRVIFSTTHYIIARYLSFLKCLLGLYVMYIDAGKSDLLP